MTTAVPGNPVGALIESLLGSAQGQVLDRARVVDHLLDLRLAADGDRRGVAAIDEALRSVPGRTLVSADWFGETLRRLALACDHGVPSLL